MTQEPTQLGDTAFQYAREAVELDRRGLRPMATTKYQKAVDALARLIEQYPDSHMRKIYIKKIREYRERVQFLRGMMAEDAKDGITSSYKEFPSRPGAKPSLGKETSPLHQVLQSYKSQISWDDLVDLEDVKKVIKQSIVYPSVRPDLFPLGWPRGILLYGPPGCGKTATAAAVSNEVKGHFFVVDATSIMSKWLGEAEKNVALIFQATREISVQGKPAILFIDEVDSLLGIRQQEVGGEVRMRNQFLKEMDGISDKSNRKLPLYVIASTNKPWALDWGFIRRFQRRIYMPMPNKEVRTMLFKQFLEDVQIGDDMNYEALATQTENYTPSDIKEICQTAVIEVVSELFESGRASNPGSRPRSIQMSDIGDAIRRIRPSVSSEIKRVYDSWAERFKAF